VWTQRSSCMTLCTLSHALLERFIRDADETFVRLQAAPNIFEHAVQDRAAIHRLDAEAHARQRLRAKTQLRLSAESTPRLQLDRARTAAGSARKGRRLVVLKFFERRASFEQELAQACGDALRARRARLDAELRYERAQLQLRIPFAFRPGKHELVRRLQ